MIDHRQPFICSVAESWSAFAGLAVGALASAAVAGGPVAAGLGGLG
jgi:hypothetical protein